LDHWDLYIGYCLLFDACDLEFICLMLVIWNLFTCPVGSMRPYQGYLVLACLSRRAPFGDRHRLEPVKDRELPNRETVLLCLDNKINDE